MLVLLDENFSARTIYEASRAVVEIEIAKPGDKARARGAIGLAAFKRIATQVWPLGDNSK